MWPSRYQNKSGHLLLDPKYKLKIEWVPMAHWLQSRLKWALVCICFLVLSRDIILANAETTIFQAQSSVTHENNKRKSYKLWFYLYQIFTWKLNIPCLQSGDIWDL